MLFAAVIFGGVFVPSKVYAVPFSCPDGTTHDIPAGTTQEDKDALCKNNAAPQKTAPVDQPQHVKKDCPSDNNPQLSQNNCGIIKYLVLFIKFLSAIVGIVVVISIIIGGIQYSVSADEPAMVNAAKKRIMNALVALALYVFTFALLQYLIPGGVL